MGSPLGPILVSLFLSHHEENRLNECPVEFEPTFDRKYVDDIFVLFASRDCAHSFRIYMFSKHHTLHSSLEQRNLTQLHFYMSKFVAKMISLLPVFTGNQHLVEFSPNASVSLKHSKKEDFYTRYYIDVSTYALILKHFIWRLTF